MVRSTPQSAPTVLLVGAGSIAVDLVKTAKLYASSLHLESCRDFAQVSSWLQQENVALVVVDVAEEISATEVKELLWSVTHCQRPVASILLFDSRDDEARDEFLHAGAACCFPRNINPQKLAHAMDTLTFQARNNVFRSPAAEDKSMDVVEYDPTFYVPPQMEQMMHKVRRVVPQETTILLTGETGTGKTRLARFIHEMSPRRAEPLLVVDIGALAPSLIESELFGHVKGAFTGADRDRPGKFAAAGNGTLLLDEINSLPLPLQSKLLRVVDDRVFEPVGSDVPQPLQARLITASNARLEKEVAEGRFRADLFYRLNVIGFFLPPLREHINAIGPLAYKFLSEFAAKNHPDKTEISPEALGALERYPWPGNIRQLRSAIEQAVALFAGPIVELDHLPEVLRAPDIQLAANTNSCSCGESQKNHAPSLMQSHSVFASEGLTLMKTKEKAEVLRITEALRRHRNNRLRTARELGISRMSLYKKLHKYGLYRTA